MMIKNWMLSPLLLLKSFAISATPFVVKKLTFSGLARTSLGTAVFALPFKEGDRVDTSELQAAIRNLFKTEQFEAIEIYKKDGNHLEFRVKERPTLVKLDFLNLRDASSTQIEGLTKLLAAQGIRVGEPVRPNILKRVETIVIEQYRSQGYYTASVKSYLTILPNNRVHLNISIAQGRKTKIKQINFLGNKTVSAAQLKRLMLLRDRISPLNFFGGNALIYQHEWFQADLESIKGYYLNNGYPDFSIKETAVSFTPNLESIYLTIHMREGEQYVLDSLHLSGQLTPEQKNKLLPLLQLPQERTYNLEQLQRIENKIREVLDEEGHAAAKVQIEKRLDAETKKAAITFLVSPGPKLAIRYIMFSGNQTTNDQVLRRALRQLEGSTFSRKSLARSLESLRRMSFIESIDYEVLPTGEPGQIDLVFKLIERRGAGQIGAHLSYGTLNGLSIGANYDQDNILGSGWQAAIDLSFSRSEQNFSASATTPHVTPNGVALRASYLFQHYNGELKNLATVDSHVHSVGNSFIIPFSDEGSWSLGCAFYNRKLTHISHRFEVSRYLDSIGHAPIFYYNEVLELNTFVVDLGFSINKFNRGWLPTKGVKFDVTAEASLPSQTGGYMKGKCEITGLYPMDTAHRFVLFGKCTAGYGTGYGKNYLPFFKNFRVDPTKELRFLEAEHVGPKHISEHYISSAGNSMEVDAYRGTDIACGGNAKLTGSFGLIFPVPWLPEDKQKYVRTFWFLDAGNLWNTNWKKDEAILRQKPISLGEEYIQDFSRIDAIRCGTGVAIGIYTPVAPLLFTFGKSFKAMPGESEARFQFSITREISV